MELFSNCESDQISHFPSPKSPCLLMGAFGMAAKGVIASPKATKNSGTRKKRGTLNEINFKSVN
jgi:hypothetical protein